MNSFRTPPRSSPSSPTNCTRKPSICMTLSRCSPGMPCAVRPSSKCCTGRSAICVRAERTMSLRRITIGSLAIPSRSSASSSVRRPPSSFRRSCMSFARMTVSSRMMSSSCRCTLSFFPSRSEATRTSSRVAFEMRTRRHREERSTLPKKSVARCGALAISMLPRSDSSRSYATRSSTAFCSAMGSSPKIRTTRLSPGTTSSPQGSRLTMPQSTTVT
mmetsp:Transcript_42640/g.110213  ORF Transcript_42640/g.110213 Transcript_42640/m.110213 type:complete len:217 (-) Transcript_42640:771-1421(-)